MSYTHVPVEGGIHSCTSVAGGCHMLCQFVSWSANHDCFRDLDPLLQCGCCFRRRTSKCPDYPLHTIYNPHQNYSCCSDLYHHTVSITVTCDTQKPCKRMHCYPPHLEQQRPLPCVCIILLCHSVPWPPDLDRLLDLHAPLWCWCRCLLRCLTRCTLGQVLLVALALQVTYTHATAANQCHTCMHVVHDLTAVRAAATAAALTLLLLFAAGCRLVLLYQSCVCCDTAKCFGSFCCCW